MRIPYLFPRRFPENALGEKGEPKAQASTNSSMAEGVTRENLPAVLRPVRSKRGSAGVDGRTGEERPASLRGHGPQLREQRRTGHYEPPPSKGVEIPKPEGGVPKRGIPTVGDGFIQPAVLPGLPPKWALTVSEPSLRIWSGTLRLPRRRPSAALAAGGLAVGGDIDREQFFDRVKHEKLMDEVEKRSRDKGVLALIGRYRKAGGLAEGVGRAIDQGRPHGGPLTPLRSHLLLEQLDRELENRGQRCGG